MLYVIAINRFARTIINLFDIIFPKYLVEFCFYLFIKLFHSFNLIILFQIISTTIFAATIFLKTIFYQILILN